MNKRAKKNVGEKGGDERALSAEDILLYHSYHDSLTALPNRILFEYRLHQSLARALGQNSQVAVLALDVDRLKNTNHVYSHEMGDALLGYVSHRLRSSLGPGDLLARLGGGEFLMAFDVKEAQQAAGTARHILESLRSPFVFSSSELTVTVSMGISLSPLDGAEPKTLLRNAEAALARAKSEGKNNYQFYTPAMNSNTIRQLTLENSLRRALKQKEFVLHYQPQVDLRSGRVVGVEALIRWEVPGYGLVSPAEFIPIAEETGLIVPMGEWVLRTACEQQCLWQKQGIPPLAVAVNLSARQFQDQQLVDSISRITQEVGIDPKYLELEITESQAMQNADYTMAVLRDLKTRGFRVSIDDFGTGYSSLSYLKRFPIDCLKIDRSFVKDISTDLNDRSIASTIIVLAHNLKLEVVAEGVETMDQLSILRDQQCDRMQGYLFSRPVPAAEVEAMVRSGKWLPVKSIDSAPAQGK